MHVPISRNAKLFRQTVKAYRMHSFSRVLITCFSILGLACAPASQPIELANQEHCWQVDVEVTTTPTPPQIASGLLRYHQIAQALEGSRPDLLLVGDSLLQGWRPEWLDSAFPRQKALNLAIGGDRTQNVVWQLAHLNLKVVAPRNVIILVGSNNLIARDIPCAIADGVSAIILQARAAWPSAHILVLGVPPMGSQFNFRGEARRELNSMLVERANSMGI
jgi:hypothetical protein